MIHDVEGDILLSKAVAIAHGIAPHDNFGQGLALSLREHYPSLYKDFRHFCKSEHPKPGTVWLWGSSDGKRIINLFTQEGAYDHGAKPGKATVEHVNHALRELRKVVDREGYASLALPKLATGVGGLGWGEVYPLIKNHLGSLKIPIYIYTVFHPGQQAKEER